MTGELPCVHVRIGQLALGRAPTILKATLGSCVGVAFLWRERALFGLAHCLLPNAPDPTSELGARYVDQAIVSLLRLMEAGPQHHGQIEACLAGGGNMTQAGGRRPHVGQLNSEAALQLLKQQRIKILSADLGGFHARQMLLDCATASVSVVHLPAPLWKDGPALT